MRLVLAAALVASTGCAQIFGLDQTTAADANSDFATVQVQHVSIGASVVKTPQDMAAQMATFYDDSAGTFAPIPGVLSGTDTFSAEAIGTPATLYTVPDTLVTTRMLALGARAQRANLLLYEHPSSLPPLPNSSLDVQVTLPSAYVTGESFVLQAIGAWMTHTLAPTTELPMPDMAMSTINPATPIAYSGFSTMVGGNKPARINAADVVLLLRYLNNVGMNGGSHITGVFQAQFDQTDSADAVMGTMTAVPASTTVTAAVDAAAFATRFASVRPSVLGTNMAWSVQAAPGWSLGTNTGVKLINASVAMADTTLTGMYGNPFESLDWKAIFTFSCSSPRTYALSDGTNTLSLPLSAGFGMLAEPSATLTTANNAGLPITIAANQTPLVTDYNASTGAGTLVVDPAQPVVVEATLDRPTNTAYELILVEVSIDTSGAAPAIARKTIVDILATGTPTFKVPPDLFTVGKKYFFTIRSFQGGLANAATGDVQTVSLPYSYAQNDSAVFIVGMP